MKYQYFTKSTTNSQNTIKQETMMTMPQKRRNIDIYLNYKKKDMKLYYEMSSSIRQAF